MSKFQPGQLVTVPFEGRLLQVIVIDPQGLGVDQPTVGLGFRMMERHTGIDHSTLSRWVVELLGVDCLKLPSGKAFRVVQIFGMDGNTYTVVEASDWVDLAVDLLINPGKLSKNTKQKLGEFLRWFAVKGFYAETYITLKGTYSAKDSRATTKWLEMRQLGKVARKDYTDLLQIQGCKSYEYAYWTDYIYKGLFGAPARRMKQVWTVLDGNRTIARNYIPEAKGLHGVSYCEDMVTRIFAGCLEEAHDNAIHFTRRKFDTSAWDKVPMSIE